MDDFVYIPFGGAKKKRDPDESSSDEDSSDEELEDLDTLTDQHADSKAYKAKVKSKPLLRGGAAKRARKASTDASSSATPSASSPSPAPRKGANGRTTRRSTAQAVLDAEDDNDKPSPSSSPGKRAGSKPEVCEIDESDSDDDLGPVDVVDDDPETQRLMKEAAERRRKREALQQQFANDLTPDDDAEAEVEEVGETRAPRVLQKRVRAEDVEEVMDSDDERGGGVGGGGGGASAAVVAGAIKLKLKLDGKEKDQQFAVKPENPLQKLLNAFCARNGYKPEDVKLMFDGEVLPYNQTANDLDMEDDDMVEVNIKEGAIKSAPMMPMKKKKTSGTSSSSSSSSSSSGPAATPPAPAPAPAPPPPGPSPINYAPDHTLVLKVLVPGKSKPKKLKFPAHDPLHKLLTGFCSATKEPGSGLAVDGVSLDLARTPAQLGLREGDVIDLVR